MSQLNRVIAVMLWSKGWEKQRRLEMINGKQVWWYRLVPATSQAAQEVAA